MVHPLPYTAVVPTVFGQMLIHRLDTNHSDMLFKTGLPRDYGEIAFLKEALARWRPDPIVVDVGAHFGTFSLGLLPAVGNGVIHAFEPQRIIFNMLAGTVALNAIENLFCYNIALGREEGLLTVPQFNYREPLSFGSIEFGSEQIEPLSQNRNHDPSRAERVRVTALDALGLGRVDLLKVDAEGMDFDVLLGAQQTLRRSRPLLFVETIKIDRDDLRAHMRHLDYVLTEIGNDDFYVPRESTDRLDLRQNLKS